MPDQQLTWSIVTPERVAGTWPIRICIDGRPAATVCAVLGEGQAPQPREDVTINTGRRRKVERQVQVWHADRGDAIVKQVEVRYRDPNPVRGEGTFWRPLDWFEVDGNTGPVKALFPPWLVLYIGVYVVVMLGTKTLIKVA